MGYVSHYIRLYLSHFVDFILPSYFKKCQRVYRSTDPSFLIMLDFKPIHRWFLGGNLFAMCQPNCNLNGKKNMDHLLPSVLTQYYYIWYKSPSVDISVTNPSWSDKPTETYHQFTKKTLCLLVKFAICGFNPHRIIWYGGFLKHGYPKMVRFFLGNLSINDKWMNPSCQITTCLYPLLIQRSVRWKITR